MTKNARQPAKNAGKNRARSIIIGIPLFLCCSVLLANCAGFQRSLLFYPSHGDHVPRELVPWIREGEIIGYVREVAEPESIWLMLHGNSGQAAGRTYALPCFPENAAVYILEYPGYGQRKGKPASATINAAAKAGFLDLKARYPDLPVCVAGESIGTGPASFLGSLETPPDKIVLVVPFDTLSDLARHHVRYLPVGLLLADCWDNGKALSTYKGPVDIFATPHDRITPFSQAVSLAQKVPHATFYRMDGGHNDWSRDGRVRLLYP
ncbi:hypothetical protein LJC22_01395 [Desulfosarcina sp. OttesenSCG-928-G10]|nr:hypothetical protein [Desulfosarcina sp. OttesenSCG-928-G10]